MWQCYTKHQDSVSVIPIFFQDLQPTLPTLPTSQIQLYPQIAFSSHVTVMNLLALAYQQVTIKWYIPLGQPGGGGSNPL